MLVLLLFAVGFMAVGGLVNLAVLLFQGWEPVGFWTLFGDDEEGRLCHL
jgi:bacitracin transport system permease protein